jgi:hypothetical protein
MGRSGTESLHGAAAVATITADAMDDRWVTEAELYVQVIGIGAAGVAPAAPARACAIVHEPTVRGG